MTTTNFTAGTVVTSDWLNDVDAATYEGTGVFTPAGTGAVATTTQAKLREYVSSYDKLTAAEIAQVVAGTATDNTTAIQNLLTGGGVIFIDKGTYVVNPLTMVSNTVLWMHPQAKLLAKTGYGASDRLLNLSGIENVTIHGNHATIEMIKAEAVSGGDAHCVNMYGVTDVTIYDLHANNGCGDGFYVGNTVCRNVSLINCFADNNYRNGLSITNVIGMNVIGGAYTDTDGNAAGPCAGIDIESNLLDNYYLQGININGVYTSGNTGAGMLVTPQSKFAPVSINIDNYVSSGDGSTGSTGKGALSVTAAMAYTGSTSAPLIGKIDGSILITNVSILDPLGSGFVSVNWTENAPYTKVTNLYVRNPFSGSGSPADRSKVGILIRGETPSSGTYGTSTGNITIEGVRIEDTRTVPLMYLPIYAEPADEATKPLENISITKIGVVAGQWTYASGAIPFVKSGSLATTNLVLEYENEFTLINGASSINIGNNDIGVTRTNSGNANYVLPDAALYIGSTFHFYHSASGNYQITLTAGDSILQYSPEAGAGIISRNVGSAMSLKAVSASEWKVVAASLSWGVKTGYEPRYPETYDTAAPVAGTWVRGDRIYNKNPSASGTEGWVCVTDGTPGTWKTFGVIAA